VTSRATIAAAPKIAADLVALITEAQRNQGAL
jgi:hypothetical protein